MESSCEKRDVQQVEKYAPVPRVNASGMAECSL
jgi:hypothetical protein